MGCLIVYDITKRSTFNNIEDWVTDFTSLAPTTCVVMLVGNKCDLEDQREVSTKEAKQHAGKLSKRV